MYFDVTREELLELIAAYEAENSFRSLATKANVSYSALIDFKRGKSAMLGDKNLRAVMAILRPQDSLDLSAVPVVGYVGAGAEVFPIDDHHKGAGLYEAEAPPYIPHGKGIALEVRGDSMMPFIQDGFILFYSERYHGVPPELVNKMCVVQVQGGPCLVKWIRKGDGIGRFTLESINPKDEPIRNVVIEWSAFVDSIKQR